MKKQDSFFLKGECKDPGYRNVRDLPHYAEYRGFVEDLWKDYKPYADRHFLKEAQKNFLDRFWEMYICVAFFRRGFLIIKKGNEGPDFLTIIDDKKVWVEAVAPGPGVDQNQIVEPIPGEVFQVPSVEIILRYTTALSSKLEKYREYRGKGIVGENDCYVVAINSRKIPYAPLGWSLPYHVHALLPFGNLTMFFEKKTSEVKGPFYEYRDSVLKGNGAEVSTKPFLEPAYAGISAVIHSGVDCANGPSELGADFDILHNPLANVLLYDGLEWCRHRFYQNGELETVEPKTDNKLNI